MEYDRVVVAAFETGAAPDARLGIDYMLLLSNSDNRVVWTYPCAEGATVTGISNFVCDKVSTNRGRAPMFYNVGQIFIAEVPNGGQYRVRRRLA